MNFPTIHPISVSNSTLASSDILLSCFINSLTVITISTSSSAKLSIPGFLGVLHPNTVNAGLNSCLDAVWCILTVLHAGPLRDAALVLLDEQFAGALPPSPQPAGLAYALLVSPAVMAMSLHGHNVVSYGQLLNIGLGICFLFNKQV